MICKLILVWQKVIASHTSFPMSGIRLPTAVQLCCFTKESPFTKSETLFATNLKKHLILIAHDLILLPLVFFCLDMIISSMKILHNFRSKEGTTSLCTSLVLSCARANTKPDLYFAFNPTVIHHAKNEGSALPLVH
jgi:hypothetical protein